MNQLLEDLLKVISLERLEMNLFRGQSRDIGSAQVFGGQVLGQALMAAVATVEERLVHSLHAYFLRRGDFDSPIVYEVDRARDGRHFSTRRVVAIQHGEQIFNMSASFQSEEAGFDHQLAMPDAPPPESLAGVESYVRAALPSLPDKLAKLLGQQRPFDFRPVEPPRWLDSGKRAPQKRVWLRAVDRLPDEQSLHRCLLAYVADFHLIDTALNPHGVSPLNSKLILASIDHAMWFHRPFRIDDWLLCSIDSPSASGARGFAQGRVFDRKGVLVASVAQEGLMRLVN